MNNPLFNLYINLKKDISFYLEIKKCNQTLLNRIFTIFSVRMIPVFIYRVSFFFNQINLKPVSKLFSLINFIFFGIEIAINTKIGPGLFFPHTQGTVIGAIAIGEKTIIYQNVTIGAKFIDIGNELSGRPKIGNNVKIATGSIIIGAIEIGDNVIISPNLVITNSIETNKLVIANT